jgi:2-keto-4-pentenoate hydratase/2-oxohepta-3-ene-1,7-dioic acid hydratase in catechol pathway
LPWERSKSFDRSAAISPFVPISQIGDLQNIDLQLDIGGKTRQKDSSASMIWKIEELLQFMVRYFTLVPGDIVLTGTTAGVGVLTAGDLLELKLANQWSWKANVES